MKPSLPPLARAPARDRNSELIGMSAVALAASASVPAGIAVGAVLLALHLRASNRSLSAPEIIRYATPALGAILPAQVLKDWPDFKQGFVDGWRQGRSL